MKRSISTVAVVAFSLAGSLAGCSKAVEITSPTSSPLTAPLTAFTVKFSPYFSPGSFSAQFDGKDVTSKFVPPAAPGGMSTMMGPAPERLEGGTLVGGGPRARDISPVSTSNAPSSGPGTPDVVLAQAGGPSGGTTPSCTVPAAFQHQLHVSGQCNGMICATTDDQVFVPIHLTANPATLDLRIQQKVPATVSACPASSVPITVTVKPLVPSVSLDGRPAGSSIMRTIPVGGISPQFTITGLANSTLSLVIEATGVQTATIQGTVNP